MFTIHFQFGFLALTALLLAAAVTRWIRTPEQHPEYAARSDMMWLLTAVLAGQVIMLGRERAALNSPAFWLCNVLLLLPTAFALRLLWQLFRAYRVSSGKTE